MKTTYRGYFTALMAVILLFGCRNFQKEAEVEAQWVPLFNGKDLTGWDIKIRGFELGVNYRNTFRVENGLLKVSYDDYDTFNEEFGHLFYQHPFSSYRLRVEYRFVGDQVPDGPGWALRNNGLMLHSQSAQSMGVDQDFPISLEAQLLGGAPEGERSTMNLCTPGSNVVMQGELREAHCIDSRSKTYRGDGWVTAEVIVYRDSVIHHLVEGDTVLTYSHPVMGGGAISGYDSKVYVEGKPMTSGYIAIQAESHPTEFRKIELMELDPK